MVEAYALLLQEQHIWKNISNSYLKIIIKIRQQLRRRIYFLFYDVYPYCIPITLTHTTKRCQSAAFHSQKNLLERERDTSRYICRNSTSPSLPRLDFVNEAGSAISL